MSMMTSVTFAALLSVLPAGAFAQGDKPVSKSATISATATIQAINRAARSVTLRNERGEEDTFIAGPEVVKFDQLKVGDTIRATYHEAVVFQVRKAGSKEPESVDALAAGRLKAAPGGAAAMQQMRTVTVKAVDPSVPSITVVTADGQTITRRIENKKNIEGVTPGDRIDITYTQALLVNAESAK
jgi:hypothetical protein